MLRLLADVITERLPDVKIEIIRRSGLSEHVTQEYGVDDDEFLVITAKKEVRSPELYIVIGIDELGYYDAIENLHDLSEGNLSPDSEVIDPVETFNYMDKKLRYFDCYYGKVVEVS